MLKPKTASEMATPGQMAIQGARNMYVRPEPESIAPHAGYGGGTPKPRNESADSARMAAPRPMVGRVITGAPAFGRRGHTMIPAGPHPPAPAAPTHAPPAT